MSTEIEIHNSPLMDSFYGSIGASEAVKANGFLFISGCVGFDADKNLPEDFGAQCRNAFTQVRSVIAQAGADPGRIVQLMTFSTDTGHENMMDDLSILFAEKAAVLPECKAVVSCLRALALALPAIKVEIQAVVAL